MNILIIAHFTGDFSESDNGRFLYLAKQLSERHQVEIVTTSFRHGTKARKKPVEIAYPFRITMLEEPGYRKNVDPRRLLSHRVWGRNLKKYLRTIERPDVIYCAVPSLTGPSYAARYAEKNGIRFVIDVQDLWPEAFQMVFPSKIIGSLVFAPFRRTADSIYRRADRICAVSRTYVERALRVSRKCADGATVFLGTELQTFDENARKAPSLRKPSGEIWLAYIGTLGASYDLTCVMDALRILSDEGIRPAFIVMGDGPRRAEFEAYASERNVDARFTGRLPYDEMCAILCTCDINVNPITHGAAGSIINKHGDYAASGHPVVSTQENEEYRSLVDEYRMGFNVRNGDPQDLADKLRTLILDEDLRKTMGANARRCAEEKFDRKYSYGALIEAIEGLE